jgi:hypothetical protein
VLLMDCHTPLTARAVELWKDVGEVMRETRLALDATRDAPATPERAGLQAELVAGARDAQQAYGLLQEWLKNHAPFLLG